MAATQCQHVGVVCVPPSVGSDRLAAHCCEQKRPRARRMAPAIGLRTPQADIWSTSTVGARAALEIAVPVGLPMGQHFMHPVFQPPMGQHFLHPVFQPPMGQHFKETTTVDARQGEILLLHCENLSAFIAPYCSLQPCMRLRVCIARCPDDSNSNRARWHHVDTRG
eukprot:m.557884 g.557884  ORF g.557884 m.557884 type:complete len:166 (+) comp22192_c1_seq2:2302-2799(+)